MKIQITTKCSQIGYRYFMYNGKPHCSAVVLFSEVVTDYAKAHGLTFRPEPQESNPCLLLIEWGDSEFVIPVPFVDVEPDGTVNCNQKSLDSFIRSLTHTVKACCASRIESEPFEFEIPNN